MQLVRNNPYRITGLLVGASAAEKDTQVRRLRQYIQADQEPKDDFSLHAALGELKRTLDMVQEAVSKLDLDADRMHAALFWYYNGYKVTDEPALDALKDGRIQDASDIWERMIASGDVTQRNASAFHNLSTFLLAQSVTGDKVNEKLLGQGIALKLKFLDSDFARDLKAKVADLTYKADKKELQVMFAQALQKELANYKGLSINKLVQIYAKLDFSAKPEVLKQFTTGVLEKIHQCVEVSKNARKRSGAEAAKVGQKLHADSDILLLHLRQITGLKDTSYTSASDYVSGEILQCGIDHFKHYKDSDQDPGLESLDLCEKALGLAEGNLAKQRCQDNIDNLGEWIADKPEREKQKKIASELQYIMERLERFKSEPDTPANASAFLDDCKPRLDRIKLALGAWDEFYIKISSAIAGNALGMLVEAVNAASNSSHRGNMIMLSSVVRGALGVSTRIGTLDMTREQQTHYQKNHSTLKSIALQLGIGGSGGTIPPEIEEESWFAKNAWWVLAAVGLFIGVKLDMGGGAIFLAVLGGSIGAKMS